MFLTTATVSAAPSLIFVTLLGRADTVSYAFEYFLQLMHIGINYGYQYQVAALLTNYQILIFSFAIIGVFPIFQNILSQKNKISNILINGVLVILYILSLMSLLTSSYNPFIYFRF